MLTQIDDDGREDDETEEDDVEFLVAAMYRAMGGTLATWNIDIEAMQE